MYLIVSVSVDYRGESFGINGDVMMFKDYTSFLEVTFAVNVLFAAWDGAYSRLRDWLMEISPEGWASQLLKSSTQTCQVLGGLLAVVIAVALFFVPPDKKVDFWGQVMIGATGVIPIYLVIYIGYIPFSFPYRWYDKRRTKRD